MKFAYFIVFLLFLPISIAQQEINFFKETHSQGETAQLQISLNLDLIDDISSSQLEVLSNNNKIAIPIFLVKIDMNNYLSYFNIPLDLEDNNYTFRIKDVRYKEEGILKTKDIEKK